MNDLPVLHILMYNFALWFGLYLLARHPQKPGMRYAGLGLAAYALGLGLTTLAGDAPELTTLRTLVAIVPLVCWFLAIRDLLPGDKRQALPGRLITLLGLASIFFGLGVALLVMPQSWLSNDVILLSIGVDLALVGYAIARLDAYEEGEALLPDALRSLAGAAVGAIIFGAQVVLVMEIEQAMTPGMLFLLLAITGSVTALQTFASPLDSLLDRAVFADAPSVQESRAALQAAADAIPRRDNALDLHTMDENTFTRLTRRALSHMNNTNRLISSPLMRLPIIDERLEPDGEAENTLARAAELRVLLAESIDRLKPRDNGDYGTSDEWRYYNALYFPYVVGLKPFSHRLLMDDLSPEERDIVEWFRLQVPERTLHNWQNAAATLVAQDLRDQIDSEKGHFNRQSITAKALA